jgi:hypothetical protein
MPLRCGSGEIYLKKTKKKKLSTGVASGGNENGVLSVPVPDLTTLVFHGQRETMCGHACRRQQQKRRLVSLRGTAVLGQRLRACEYGVNIGRHKDGTIFSFPYANLMRGHRSLPLAAHTPSTGAFALRKCRKGYSRCCSGGGEGEVRTRENPPPMSIRRWVECDSISLRALFPMSPVSVRQSSICTRARATTERTGHGDLDRNRHVPESNWRCVRCQEQIAREFAARGALLIRNASNIQAVHGTVRAEDSRDVVKGAVEFFCRCVLSSQYALAHAPSVGLETPVSSSRRAAVSQRAHLDVAPRMHPRGPRAIVGFVFHRVVPPPRRPRGLS